MSNQSFGKGVFFAVFAYLLWGALPIYWKILSTISHMHLLGFRILISLLSVSIALLLIKNFSWFKFYKDKKTFMSMILA